MELSNQWLPTLHFKDFQLMKCKVVLHKQALTESSSLELPMVGGLGFCENVLHNEGWSSGILSECTMENAGTSKQLWGHSYGTCRSVKMSFECADQNTITEFLWKISEK